MKTEQTLFMYLETYILCKKAIKQLGIMNEQDQGVVVLLWKWLDEKVGGEII